MSTLRSRVGVLTGAVVLIVLGAWLVASGPFSSGGPPSAAASPAGTPTIATLAPSSSASPTPMLSASAGATATAITSPSPEPTRTAVATRVTIPALGIDLPVVVSNPGYPFCNVALYLPTLGQPGQGRAIYLFAHARTGMFLPIYELAIVEGTGSTMLGMRAFVYTSDNYRFEYEIREIRLHQTDLDAALAATTEQLWLQTSEGPAGTPGKTQLVAYPVGVERADPIEAHPTPMPVTCG